MSWYKGWHEMRLHKHFHTFVLVIYVLTIVSSLFNFPGTSYAAWNYSKTWTTKSDIETGTTLTNVAVSGDDDADDVNNNDGASLTSQAEKRQTIAAGVHHSMIIKTDGTLASVGYNNAGQLGIGDNIYRNSWTTVPFDGAISVSSLGEFSLVLRNDGTVWGTGYNLNGQFGDGTTAAKNLFSQVRESATVFLTNVKKITTGYNHSLAIKNDGTLWVTGYNGFGQLGLGNTTSKTYWTQVLDIGGITNFEVLDIGAGAENTVVLIKDLNSGVNKVFGAGRNLNGELGIGDNTQRNSWSLSPISDVTKLGVGYSHTLAVVNNGTNNNAVWATGANGSGRLGIGGGPSVNTWVQTNLDDIETIFPGNTGNLALRKDGKVWGCGDNSVWQLNTGDTISRYNWIETNYYDVSQISLGINPHVLVLKKNGALDGVGYNYHGPLGAGDQNYRNVLTGPDAVISQGVGAGYQNSFFIKNNNLYAAGYNGAYQLGISDAINRTTYSQVPITNVSKMVSGENATYVLKTDGSVWAIGVNGSGSVGVGNTTGTFSTFQQGRIDATTFLSSVTDIWSGRGHAFALTSSGELYGVGLNTNGQLGLADTTNRLYWTLIPVANVTKACPGYGFTGLLLADGTVLTAGSNTEGQLGLGNNTQFTAWQTSSAGAVDLWCGFYNVFIKKPDGIYATGLNSQGQFGNNSTTSRNIWTKLTALDGVDVKKISAGYGHAYVLKTDGTVLSSGYNYYGQLGVGDFNRRQTWQTVSVSGVDDIVSGYYFSVLRKSDGTLLGAGADVYGQLGLGTPFKKQLFTTQTAVKQPSPFISPGTITGLRLDAGAVVNWVNLTWVADVPVGTILKLRSRGAPNEAGLTSAEWSGYYDTSGDPISSTNSQWLELEVTMESSDGAFTPNLSSISVNYYSDLDAPTNPTTVQAWTDNTKAVSLSDSTWASSENIYFEWSGATDLGGSEIKGYYVYFGTDSTADPKTAGDFQVTSSFEGMIPESDSGKKYYLCISSEDNADNRFVNAAEPYYKTFEYRYDNTVPDINTANVNVSPVGWSTVNNFSFSWQEVADPDINGGNSGIRGYRYKRKNGTDTWSVETANRSVSGIEAYQNGQNTFELKAIDNAGNESAVKETNYFYNADAPTLPLALSVTPQSSVDNNFDFSWEAPASANGGVKGYYYSVNATPSRYNTTYTTATSTGEIHAATQQSFNTFYVVAMDSSDNINWGNYASIQFECNTPAPGAPTTPEIFDTSNRDLQKYSIALSWTEPVNKGAGFSGYIIERSTDGETFEQIGTSGGTSYLDAGLESKTYYYRMISRDNSGNTSAPSTVVSLLPTGKYTTPPTITVDPEVAVKVSTAEIRWVTDRVSSSFVEIGEDINYGLTQGQFEFVADHKVKIERLKPDTIYHFRVKFVDIDGNIGYSNDLTLRTEPAPRVERVSIQDVRLYTAVLTWYTSEPAVTSLLYGKNAGYGSEIQNVSGGATTVHSVRLDGLDHSSVYHFAVKVRDIDDNEVLSDDYSFETQKYPRLSLVRFEPLRDQSTATFKVTWESNVPTTSIVEFQPEGGRVQETVKSKLELKHEVVISGLFDNTYYLFRVLGVDQYGNEANSDMQRTKTDFDTRPPEISNITSEISSSGFGAAARSQLVVSWETDEPSTSQVEYGLGATGENYDIKSQEDASLTTSHVLVITGLKPSSAYHFRAVSRDGARNQGVSESQSILTEQAGTSVLDIIINSLQSSLGWLFGI